MSTLSPPMSFWMPEPILMKVGMYIVAPEPISAAYVIHSVSRFRTVFIKNTRRELFSKFHSFIQNCLPLNQYIAGIVWWGGALSWRSDQEPCSRYSGRIRRILAYSRPEHMMQRYLRFEIIDSHSWNFKNLNATTRQQMALQGKIKRKKSPNGSWTHRVHFFTPHKNCRKDDTSEALEINQTIS
jgi:hypothetical protein